MIKVQTLRLRGLCASSLLALAACSGTPSENVSEFDKNANDGAPMTSSAPTNERGPARSATGDRRGTPVDASARRQGQDPQGQGPGDRAAIVRKAVENARASLDLRLFEDARNEAAYALELDNDNKEARDILQRCNQILGDSLGEGETGRQGVTETVLLERIKLERERAIVERDMQEGRAFMSQGNYGRAIDAFERAATTMRFSIYVQANETLRKETEAALADAREQKAKAEKAALDSLTMKSQAEIDRIRREGEIQREGKVTRLLEQANVRFQNNDYTGSVALVDQALMLDPANPVALELRELADRARHNQALDTSRERWRTEWNKTFLELQHSLVPQTASVVFDPQRWSEVASRKPSTYTSVDEIESPDNQEVLKRLNETVLEHTFASATVQDWAAYYGQLTGVTFYVTPEVKEMPAEQTTLTEFRLTRRSVGDALRAIQAQTGVAYKVKDALVHLVSPTNAIGTLRLQNYKVQDLVMGVRGTPGPNLRLQTPGDDNPVFQPPEEEAPPTLVDEGRLVDLIKSTVATDKWDGAPFTITPQNGVLYIRADGETHVAVDHLLRELRRHVGIQIDVEARFLTVEDSFLEDVGIDLRGLGNQASQGVPGRGLEKQGDRSNAGFDDFGPRNQQNAASPGIVGTGTTPGVFYDNGGDGDLMARVENLYNQTLGGRNGGLTNAGGLSLQYAFLDDTEVEVVLRAVSKQERKENIDAPRLLVYNNTQAQMHFLRNIAYIKDFEVEIAQAAAVANPVVGTVFDGVALDVRPVVDADMRFITMELKPTVMTLQVPIPTFTTTLGVGNPISIQLPEVTLQRVRTTVTMPDGGTMMLGGMRLVERQNLRSSVPLLGSLPGLGWLFSRNGTSVQNRKILILIHANIVLMDEHEPTGAAISAALANTGR